MPDKVVDASILAAIAFEEPRAAEGEKLIEGAALFAPSLLPYELCSAARKRAFARPAETRSIAAALDTALAANVVLLWVPPAQLLQLALASGLTAYDAAYLWVARERNCELVTFDERLARPASVS